MPVERKLTENPGKKARPGSRFPWPSTQPRAQAHRPQGSVSRQDSRPEARALNASVSPPTRSSVPARRIDKPVSTSRYVDEPASTNRHRRAGIDEPSCRCRLVSASRPASQPAHRYRLVDEPASTSWHVDEPARQCERASERVPAPSILPPLGPSASQHLALQLWLACCFGRGRHASRRPLNLSTHRGTPRLHNKTAPNVEPQL